MNSSIEIEQNIAPPGFTITRIGWPKAGEKYLNNTNQVSVAHLDHDHCQISRLIVIEREVENTGIVNKGSKSPIEKTAQGHDSYTFTTIEQVFELVPRDKINHFAADLANCMEKYHLIKDAAAKANVPGVQATGSMIWIDDGKNEILREIHYANGKSVKFDDFENIDFKDTEILQQEGPENPTWDMAKKENECDGSADHEPPSHESSVNESLVSRLRDELQKSYRHQSDLRESNQHLKDVMSGYDAIRRRMSKKMARLNRRFLIADEMANAAMKFIDCIDFSPYATSEMSNAYMKLLDIRERWTDTRWGVPRNQTGKPDKNTEVQPCQQTASVKAFHATTSNRSQSPSFSSPDRQSQQQDAKTPANTQTPSPKDSTPELLDEMRTRTTSSPNSDKSRCQHKSVSHDAYKCMSTCNDCGAYWDMIADKWIGTDDPGQSPFIGEARQMAAQCWCDDETRNIEMDFRIAEAVARRIACWMDTAAIHAKNETFYRDLLHECAENLGPLRKLAYTQDDGGTVDCPISLKIPGLVARLATIADESEKCRANVKNPDIQWGM